ncbi:MAG: hypothetical protein Q8R92_13680 [Deltaproteobacteria bacterium]|nr:hypothetical protein [Deltaproteobacteria bacterium]
MKFEFIYKTDVPVMSYGRMVSTGDIVELEGNLAEKAKAHVTHYRLLTEPQDGAAAATDAEQQDYAQHGLPTGLDELRAAYEAKFGKAPHHRKSAETLREELE